MKKVKFSKTIYVRWEDPGRSEIPYMVCEAEIPGGDNGDKVAIYELKEVKTKIITEELR